MKQVYTISNNHVITLSIYRPGLIARSDLSVKNARLRNSCSFDGFNQDHIQYNSILRVGTIARRRNKARHYAKEMNIQVESHGYWLVVSTQSARFIHQQITKMKPQYQHTSISNVSTTITMDHNHHKPKSSVEFVALPFEFIESLAAKAPLPSLSHGIAYSVALLDAPWGSLPVEQLVWITKAQMAACPPVCRSYGLGYQISL